jgi:hypothetical protein
MGPERMEEARARLYPGRWADWSRMIWDWIGGGGVRGGKEMR